MDDRPLETPAPQDPVVAPATPDASAPPKRRGWRGSAGVAVALVLAFVWGGIAYRELSPKKTVGTVAAASGPTAVRGSEAPPSWMGDFASAFCKGDAKTIAPRMGPPLTNNIDAIENALAGRDWTCSDIRFAGGGLNPKGAFYMFISRDGQNAEQWWVFTVVGDQVVGID